MKAGLIPILMVFLKQDSPSDYLGRFPPSTANSRASTVGSLSMNFASPPTKPARREPRIIAPVAAKSAVRA